MTGTSDIKTLLKSSDIKTILKKIASGEIPFDVEGVDELTPELQEDIPEVIRAALIKLQKEQQKQ